MAVIKRVTYAGSSATLKARRLSTSAPRQGSPLFALGALSNSRETQHFSRESRLSHVEHSPNLQLIRSSEVVPFARPVETTPAQPALRPIQSIIKRTPAVQVDGRSEAELLSVGRAILLDKNDQIAKLKQALANEQERTAKREATYALARTRAQERINRLHSEASSERRWKWALAVLGLSVGGWAYAWETGQLSYAFGNADPRNTLKKPVEKKKAPETKKPKVVSPPKAVLPVVKAPVIEVPPPPPRPSLLNRLFWSS